MKLLGCLRHVYSFYQSITWKIECNLNYIPKCWNTMLMYMFCIQKTINRFCWWTHSFIYVNFYSFFQWFQSLLLPVKVCNVHILIIILHIFIITPHILIITLHILLIALHISIITLHILNITLHKMIITLHILITTLHILIITLHILIITLHILIIILHIFNITLYILTITLTHIDHYTIHIDHYSSQIDHYSTHSLSEHSDDYFRINLFMYRSSTLALAL